MRFDALTGDAPGGQEDAGSAMEGKIGKNQLSRDVLKLNTMQGGMSLMDKVLLKSPLNNRSSSYRQKIIFGG